MLGPATGDQACGEVGEGRMFEPRDIVAALLAAPENGDGPLTGQRVVVTAGPTREAIDPVRYLSNRSSGKMGYAVAAAARRAGAEVVLVSGPVDLAAPVGVRLVAVETAAQMRAAVRAELAGASLFISAAAVADYRPAEPAPQKMKKQAGELSLQLLRNPDILAEVAAASPRPFVVGFAAETENVEANAQLKLEGKSLDMIAANKVGANCGFDREDNALVVLWPGGRQDFGCGTKTELAERFVRLIAERMRGGRQTQAS
jgi:phosphopantothenoylcysteine decarboxylase/phosphopantothenate--cysteine ligase